MSLARRQLVQSLDGNRTEQTKEECKRRLTNRLEMAKSRYSKGNVVDASLIEVNENGVVKKILVPLSTVALNNNQKSAAASSNSAEKNVVPIARKKRASEPNSKFLSTVINARILSSPDRSTETQLGQNAATYATAATCTSFVGLPQTSSLRTNSSLVQTIVINPGPIIISSNGNRPNGHLLPLTYSQQQPVVLTQKSDGPIRPRFVLQTGTNGVQSIIQIPNQAQQIQLVGNQPSLIGSNIGSLNQSQLFMNQPVLSNALVLAPQVKPFVLNQTNQTYNQRTAAVTVIDGSAAKLLIQQPQQTVSGHTSSTTTQSPSTNTGRVGDAKHPAKKRCKTVKASGIKKILPKGKVVQAGVSSDYQSSVNDIPPARCINVQPEEDTIELCDSSNDASLSTSGSAENPITLKAVQEETDGQRVSAEGKNDAINGLNAALRNGSYVKVQSSMPTLFTNALTSFDIKNSLGNQVARVVLNPINIIPDTSNSKDLSNEGSIAFQNLEMCKYKEIRSKPFNMKLDYATKLTEHDQNLASTSGCYGISETSAPPRKRQKFSKTNTDSESDYAIAQILDTDDTWVDDEDCRYGVEAEIRKGKKCKSVDKSYRCHLSKSVEPNNHPRTRSSFKSGKL